jgi:asparagine synthase (glutamine-hydrolysing)
MCGIVGVVGPGSDSVNLRGALRSLEHRGRDHTAMRTGPGFALGYCRLAIRGVGERDAVGHQPFVAAGTSWLGFGVGEIYNAEQVRRGYAGVTPEGDIGAILATYLAAGTQGLERISGEFACCLFDPDTDQLVLGRDHLGTRGLFYTECNGWLCFASEVKALAAMGVELSPDATTVASYLRFNYPLAPRTWYDGIASVPAGSALIWRHGRSQIVPFADIGDLAAEQCASPLAVGKDEVRRLLADAITSRTRSDVTLGQHLSGGLDSSIVAHLGGKAGQRAYTIDYSWGSQPAGMGDGYWAGEVARQLSLDWRPVAATTEDALKMVPDVLVALDGPLMSPGAVTPYLLARAAAADATKVLLQGQGADEVFLGYARFGEAVQRPDRRLAELAANVELRDVAAVAPDALDAVRESEEAMRSGAAIAVEGDVSLLLGLQVAYLRFFLHELLRIEDHVHLAWTVENRPPFLDRAVVRAGLALTVHQPARAVGKQVLRDLLLDLGSRAADRELKQQMSVPLETAAAWSAQVLAREGALDGLDSFDRDAICRLIVSPPTRSRRRLSWALANLSLWSQSAGFSL